MPFCTVGAGTRHENLIQLLSRPLFTSNCFALIRHVVYVWYALFSQSWESLRDPRIDRLFFQT
jgi:hypothetical protein